MKLCGVGHAVEAKEGFGAYPDGGTDVGEETVSVRTVMLNNGPRIRPSSKEQLNKTMIKEIEKAKPECIVYVEDSYSWLKTPGTDEHIFEWWKNYWEMNYELLQTFNIDTRNPTAPTDDENREPTATRYFMVLKRKAGTS